MELDKQFKKGSKAYNELVLALRHSDRAKKEGYYLEAYSYRWSIIEKFLIPQIIDRMLEIFGIPFSKDNINRNTKLDFQIFLLLTHEKKIFDELEKHRKIRNDIYHNCCNLFDLLTVKFVDKQSQYKKAFTDLINNVQNPLTKFFENKAKKPKSILMLDEKYKQGFEQARETIIKMIKES